METVIEWVGDLVQVLVGPLSQIIAGFIAGGVLATLMAEFLQRRRDQKVDRMRRVESLVRVYQRYRRLIRQPVDRRSDNEVDLIHADFCAEIKILKFEKQFEDECDRLYKLAQRMANIHRGQSRPGEEGNKLNQSSKEFNAILDEILEKL